MAHSHNCSHSVSASSTRQTLDELDFDRGIWSAVLYNDFEALKKHIKNGHVEDKDNSGYTALHYAARNGNLEIFKHLVSSGADVNAQTNGGVTAFHRAAMQGHNAIIEFLLKQRKINVGLLDDDGQSAMHRAAQNGHVSTVELMLTANLENFKTHKDHHARTPFDLIPAGEKYEELRKILRKPV